MAMQILVSNALFRHIATNHSPDRLVVKVRCSNNQYFRVNPVYTFIDSGAMNELEVSLNISRLALNEYTMS